MIDLTAAFSEHVRLKRPLVSANMDTPRGDTCAVDVRLHSPEGFAGSEKSLIRFTPSGVEITVRVIPRARHTICAGERDGALLIRLAAPPVEGAANDALVDFLAEALQIPRRSIRIVSGEHARRKRVIVEGLPAEDVRARLIRGVRP